MAEITNMVLGITMATGNILMFLLLMKKLWKTDEDLVDCRVNAMLAQYAAGMDQQLNIEGNYSPPPVMGPRVEHMNDGPEPHDDEVDL